MAEGIPIGDDVLEAIDNGQPEGRFIVNFYRRKSTKYTPVRHAVSRAFLQYHHLQRA